MPELTRTDILDYLDNCIIDNPGYFFMDLEHGYFYTANSRLSLFSDRRDWAIVFEKSGYGNRAGRIELELNFFGSSLRNLEPGGLYKQFDYNAQYFKLVSHESLQEIEADFEKVSPSATEVKLRETYVRLPAEVSGYLKWLPVLDPEGATFEDLGRYLAFEYETACRATNDELRTCLPQGLPLLMQIDSWHHRSYYFYVNGPEREIIGEKPSSYETFQLIADVLANADPSLYRPTLPPTSHWSNWPEAGCL